MPCFQGGSLSQDCQIFFPPFRLDIADERLWHRQRPISLRAKSFALLRYLLEHPRKLLTKDALLAAIWPDTHVSEAALPSCIREVRLALGDDPRSPRFIETVHGRGCRFIVQPQAMPAAEMQSNGHLEVAPRAVSTDNHDEPSREPGADPLEREDEPPKLWTPALQTADTTGVMVKIHDVISNMLGPLQEISQAIPILERIARAVEDRHDSSEQIGLLYQDRAPLFRADSDRLLKLAPAPAAVVARNHRFVSASDSYCRLFGFSRQQLRTLLLKDLVDEKDLERFLLANRRLFADKAKSLVFVGRRITGKGGTILTRATAWSVREDPAAGPEYVVAMHQRLADRHEAPALFARCAEKLADNRNRLLSPRARRSQGREPQSPRRARRGASSRARARPTNLSSRYFECGDNQTRSKRLGRIGLSV